MRVAHCSDVHFDWLNDLQILKYARDVSISGAECVLLSGDISQAKLICYQLGLFASVVGVPVYFVLRNHDFYGGSIASVTSAVSSLCASVQNLTYLSVETRPIQITATTTLVGHDGWYDFGYGIEKPIRFVMSDWLHIEDFANTVLQSCSLDENKIRSLSRVLATKASNHIAIQTTSAVSDPDTKNVVIVTHVPPFEESALYLGNPSDAFALPVFTSKIMGNVIRDTAQKHQSVSFTVLAGHTHDKFEGNIESNLKCIVAGADYGNPGYRLLDIP